MQVFLESHNLKNPYSGFGQFNYHLVKAFAELNDPEIRFTLHAKKTEAFKREFGDTFDYRKYHSLTRYPILRIRKKYDLWHSLNQNTKIEPRFEIPYVLTIHDVHFAEGPDSKDKTARIKRFEAKLKRADALVYISKFARKATHQYFETSDKSEHVIYNGNPLLDTTIPENFVVSTVPQKPYLFTIGEFTSRKNFHTLINMLKHLPDFELIIAGNSDRPYTEKIKKTIAENKLENRVHIPGKISETEKKYHLKNCAAFVFPSLKEGFGIPVIEALSYGTAVITSNNTSLPEVGSTYATYWEHYEPKYMAEKVLEAMNRFNNKELVEKSITHANSFSWKNTAEQYLNVYNNILPSL
ncbi:glycosyltransferase family 4 protein [Leeuwenhoekiella sp. H156]|uniref:glycosyltransferase family 4 protein n=1 Tax=Leeuwenhoekiella sp. H156 TaxID=3450128 RepID=UPI003FA478B6